VEGGCPDHSPPWWDILSSYPAVADADADANSGALFEFEEEDEEDSSATSSDSGNEELPDVYIGDQWIGDVAEDVATEHVYMQYRRAKRTWRRFTGRPVRKFRRFHKFQRRRKGKGKGKGRKGRGKGKSQPGFMWSQSAEVEDTLTYLKGKGRAKGRNSSGKGFGRKKNPRDKTGAIMKCHNCGSEDHLAARCRAPRRPKGSGKGGKMDFVAFAQPIPSEGGFPEAPGGRVF